MHKISIIGNEDKGQVIEVLDINSLSELAAAIEEDNWSPGVFREGRRTIKNFESMSLMAIDIDGGLSMEDAEKALLDYNYVIGESRNHNKEKNGQVAERFRIVFELEEPITSDEQYKATFTKIKRLIPEIDDACKDASRFFYPCNNFSSKVHKGGRKLTPEEPSLFDKPTPKIDLEEVHEGKGELWKSTLKLLQFGAKPGHRHAELIKAVGNLKEQNYTEDEAVALLDEMATRTFEKDGWAHNGLSREDLKKVRDMYSRDSKYEFKAEEYKPDFVTSLDIIDETFEYLSDKDKVKGDPTGIEGLDNLLGGGFRTGELSVLMAQAKTGKNALCHYLLHQGLRRGISWGYASRELSPATEVIPNLLTLETGINWWNENITDEVRDQLKKRVMDWPLYFSPGYGTFPIHELKPWFKLLRSVGVKMFLFDHFHYALVKEDYESTSSLIKEIKTMTKELDIHIVMIVQPRSLREGEKLSMSTLRGGAAIGQALDNLLIMERMKDCNEKNISKITLSDARHRLAHTGHIYLQYNAKTTQFTEMKEEMLEFRETRGDIPSHIKYRTAAFPSAPKVN